MVIYRDFDMDAEGAQEYAARMESFEEAIRSCEGNEHLRVFIVNNSIIRAEDTQDARWYWIAAVTDGDDGTRTIETIARALKRSGRAVPEGME